MSELLKLQWYDSCFDKFGSNKVQNWQFCFIIDTKVSKMTNVQKPNFQLKHSCIDKFGLNKFRNDNLGFQKWQKSFKVDQCTKSWNFNDHSCFDKLGSNRVQNWRYWHVWTHGSQVGLLRSSRPSCYYIFSYLF